MKKRRKAGTCVAWMAAWTNREVPTLLPWRADIARNLVVSRIRGHYGSYMPRTKTPAAVKVRITEILPKKKRRKQ